MIISCPNCDTAYNLSKEAVSYDGRKVRCKRCSHVFWARLVPPAQNPAGLQSGEPKLEIFYKDPYNPPAANSAAPVIDEVAPTEILPQNNLGPARQPRRETVMGIPAAHTSDNFGRNSTHDVPPKRTQFGIPAVYSTKNNGEAPATSSPPPNANSYTSHGMPVAKRDAPHFSPVGMTPASMAPSTMSAPPMSGPPNPGPQRASHKTQIHQGMFASQDEPQTPQSYSPDRLPETGRPVTSTHPLGSNTGMYEPNQQNRRPHSPSGNHGPNNGKSTGTLFGHSAQLAVSANQPDYSSSPSIHQENRFESTPQAPIEIDHFLDSLSDTDFHTDNDLSGIPAQEPTPKTQSAYHKPLTTSELETARKLAVYLNRIPETTSIPPYTQPPYAGPPSSPSHAPQGQKLDPYPQSPSPRADEGAGPAPFHHPSTTPPSREGFLDSPVSKPQNHVEETLEVERNFGATSYPNAYPDAFPTNYPEQDHNFGATPAPERQKVPNHRPHPTRREPETERYPHVEMGNKEITPQPLQTTSPDELVDSTNELVETPKKSNFLIWLVTFVIVLLIGLLVAWLVITKTNLF